MIRITLELKAEGTPGEVAHKVMQAIEEIGLIEIHSLSSEWVTPQIPPTPEMCACGHPIKAHSGYGCQVRISRSMQDDTILYCPCITSHGKTSQSYDEKISDAISVEPFTSIMLKDLVSEQ